MTELCEIYTSCHFLCDNINKSVELVCDPLRIQKYLDYESNITNVTNITNITNSSNFCEETSYRIDDSYTFGFIVFGLLVCGFGVFTNFFVVFVLIKYTNLSKKPTNIYLLSLSISDMLGVLCGPPILIEYWLMEWPFSDDDFGNILFKGWLTFRKYYLSASAKSSHL